MNFFEEEERIDLLYALSRRVSLQNAILYTLVIRIFDFLHLELLFFFRIIKLKRWWVRIVLFTYLENKNCSFSFLFKIINNYVDYLPYLALSNSIIKKILYIDYFYIR